MPHRLRLLAAILCLTLLLPAAAVGEDEKPKPAPDTPAPEKPAPEKPDPDDPAPPEGDTPKEGEPGKDAPGVDAPGENAPGKDEPKEGDGTKEDGKEDAPAEGPKTAQAKSPVPVPGGMVFVQGGRVWIGSEGEYLDGLLAGRPANIVKMFLYERPHHTRFLRPYFIGKYEVTNAQYHRHLQDYIVEYDTSSGSLANIDEIAASLTGMSQDQQNSKYQVVWRQLYFANKDKIWTAFKKRLNDFLVKNAEGEVDQNATARRFRFEPLPRTLKMKFYSVIPPHNWPSMDPPKDELDHPVRFVSFNDAERFAEWAGVHIPTEFEWEWAARGPGSPIFPWGNDWPPNEKFANWGGKITNAAYETTTLAVDTRDGANPDGKAGPNVKIDGDGRSWLGCHHMVGNVAEWTESWFEPYPRNKAEHNFMGRWVKVIRGGSAADGEMITLRPACRNYIGGGPDAPPYPDATFKWAGFRIASYMKSGRDQLGPIVRRAVSVNKMKEPTLDLDRFVGSITRDWVEPGATPENHVYILGRGHSIVLIPHKTFLRETGLEFMQRAWKRPGGYKNARGIAKKSESQHPEFTLGVLHTDIRLEPVLVPKPEEPAADTDKKKKKKKRRRSKRGRAKAPEVVEGSCPPGTYILGVWFGRLAILTPGMEFVAFMPLMEDQKSAFSVEKVKPDEVAPPKLAVDAELDWADYAFDMPLGGKGVDEKLRLKVTGRFQFEVGSLEAAGTWIQEDPAAELTQALHTQFLEAEAAAAKKRPAKKKKDDKKKADDKKKKKADAKKKSDDKKKKSDDDK